MLWFIFFLVTHFVCKVKREMAYISQDAFILKKISRQAFKAPHLVSAPPVGSTSPSVETKWANNKMQHTSTAAAFVF